MIAGRVEDDVIVPVSGALPASEQVRGDETAEVVGQWDQPRCDHHHAGITPRLHTHTQTDPRDELQPASRCVFYICDKLTATITTPMTRTISRKLDLYILAVVTSPSPAAPEENCPSPSLPPVTSRFTEAPWFGASHAEWNCAENYNKWQQIYFYTAISILLISSDNSFRVASAVRQKLLPYILFEKIYLYFSIGNGQMASAGNQYFANCIGTLYWHTFVPCWIWEPIYKIFYDLSWDYRKFIVRSTYDSDWKNAKIYFRNIV